MIALRPTPGFVFSHPAHAVAFGFGAGLAPTAPGTFGTLLGWVIGLALGALHAEAVLLAALIAFVLGVWACGVTGRHLGVAGDVARPDADGEEDERGEQYGAGMHGAEREADQPAEQRAESPRRGGREARAEAERDGMRGMREHEARRRAQDPGRAKCSKPPRCASGLP